MVLSRLVWVVPKVVCIDIVGSGVACNDVVRSGVVGSVKLS